MVGGYGRSSTQRSVVRVTYTEEAVADVVEAITYLNERAPEAATKLARELEESVERLARGAFEGPASRLQSNSLTHSLFVPMIPLRCTEPAPLS
jgi:plasmid stabilization system protein ParE